MHLGLEGKVVLVTGSYKAYILLKADRPDC